MAESSQHQLLSSKLRCPVASPRRLLVSFPPSSLAPLPDWGWADELVDRVGLTVHIPSCMPAHQTGLVQAQGAKSQTAHHSSPLTSTEFL